MHTFGVEGADMPEHPDWLERQSEHENERDVARRREQELKDLETESTVGARPLEGFSGAHTTWTGEQDEKDAGDVHGADEARSRELSREQVPPAPGDRELPPSGPPRGEPEGGQ